MLDKLESLEQRYLRLEKELSDPELINNNQQEWQKLSKEHASLAETVAVYRQYKEQKEALKEAREILSGSPDPDFAELAQEEAQAAEKELAHLEQRLKVLLIPKDPNDDKNVIMEIRGGAGGSEAALFAADIFKMYTRYAEINGWKTEILDSHYTDIGGVKEIVFVIEGQGAFSKLKFESGVHRVQRVPTTESGGRIHTSTVTVAVLPEAEEVEVEVNPNEIRVDTFCATGPGGQSVNTTQSAVRITHMPTGIVVSCQDEKSQLKNRDKAMRVLRARLLDKYQSEQHAELAQARKSQVGTGDRSERIRTYNFPQSRVTDHRINLTVHKLNEVLAGNLQEIIDALTTADQVARLAETE
ncbi:MAG: peptide chain release factor 1 [Firmicutes bacterium]|nr:peptide chain release factor 1 [Bacillota bacterium]